MNTARKLIEYGKPLIGPALNVYYITFDNENYCVVAATISGGRYKGRLVKQTSGREGLSDIVS